MKTKYGFKTTKQRSLLMSRIKGKDTKPELIIRKELWQNGVRYRIHDNRVIGKPDISIYKKKIAIFIDGEFWHGYKWGEKKKKISTNREYWINKIEKNIHRDKSNNRKLKKQGWKVYRYWGKEILNDPKSISEELLKEINNRFSANY